MNILASLQPQLCDKFETQAFDLKRDDLAQVIVEKKIWRAVMDYLKEEAGFVTLLTITCTDWIEEERFELNYIFAHETKRCDLMLSFSIARDGESVQTLTDRWPQAEVMERDLHEMFGIVFEGHPNLASFALENWHHTPPLRREFDTLAFVNEHFEFRKGREENVDVKAEAKRLRALKKAKAQAEAEAKKEKGADDADG
jgi:NADH-quinone oxidoreductase subunit C